MREEEGLPPFEKNKTGAVTKKRAPPNPLLCRKNVHKTTCGINCIDECIYLEVLRKLARNVPNNNFCLNLILKLSVPSVFFCWRPKLTLFFVLRLSDNGSKVWKMHFTDHCPIWQTKRVSPFKNVTTQKKIHICFYKGPNLLMPY